MELKHYSTTNHEYRQDVIQLLTILDEDSRDDESTADMSRRLFIEDAEDVTDEEALEVFYDEVTEETVICTVEGDLCGLTSSHP